MWNEGGAFLGTRHLAPPKHLAPCTFLGSWHLAPSWAPGTWHLPGYPAPGTFLSTWHLATSWAPGTWHLPGLLVGASYPPHGVEPVKNFIERKPLMRQGA